MTKKSALLFPPDAVAHAYRQLYLGGHQLRDEDHKKVQELVSLLPLVSVELTARGGTWVDACAGKSALGMIMTSLHPSPLWRLRIIERNAAMADKARQAALHMGAEVEVVVANVDDQAFVNASVGVALHACGSASDAVIDAAIAAKLPTLLCVPCCYAASAEVPERWLSAWPEHGVLRAKLRKDVCDAQRTLRLEMNGYVVEVIEFVGPTTTPHNLLWRARFVGPSKRAQAAAQRWQQLHHA
jgi:hypothetical protein